MKTTMLKLAGTLAVLMFWLVGPGPANVRGDEPPRAEKAAPPKSLIFELETDRWGSWGWGQARTMTEVRAKPGDGIGGTARGGAPPFTLVEILDKDHVKVRIAHDLVFREHEQNQTDKETILDRGKQLRIRTQSYDGGTNYTLRISDLDQVPVVKADDPKLIAAISAHANVTVDEVGSIQEIGPPGVVAPGKYGKRGRNRAHRSRFDPGSTPTDEDMKNIGQLNNLRRLILTGCTIADAGAAHLKNLTRLRELDLSGTKIGDATLPYLAGMKELEALNLSGTDISDNGVKLLLGMKFPRLKPLPGRNMPGVVHIEYTKITSEGFWELAQACAALVRRELR